MRNILAFEDLKLFKKVFEKYNVPVILVYGTLLGFYRDKDFLPGDDDIDLAVIKQIDFETRKKIGWQLYDLGFSNQQIMFNVFGRMEPAEIVYNGDEKTGIICCQRNIKFTIFFFGEAEDCKMHGKEHICVPKRGAVNLISTPARFYEKLDTIKINKETFLIPSPVEDYLSFSYKDWKDPLARDHSPIYRESHGGEMIEDVLKNNEVAIFK